MARSSTKWRAAEGPDAGMAPLLVIGYGNELRSDDGVGARVAAAIAEMQLPGVHAIACHQLTPELAEPIASARTVVFVDAARDPINDVQVRIIEPSATVPVSAHAGSPEALLALARELFAHCPLAWMICVPAVVFDFGGHLSPQAQRGLASAIEEIRKLHHAFTPARNK